jgi:hypothetical protein
MPIKSLLSQLFWQSRFGHSFPLVQSCNLAIKGNVFRLIFPFVQQNITVHDSLPGRHQFAIKLLAPASSHFARIHTVFVSPPASYTVWSISTTHYRWKGKEKEVGHHIRCLATILPILPDPFKTKTIFVDVMLSCRHRRRQSANASTKNKNKTKRNDTKSSEFPLPYWFHGLKLFIRGELKWIHTWSHISTIQQRPEAICVIINETTVHFCDMWHVTCDMLARDIRRDPAYQAKCFLVSI